MKNILHIFKTDLLNITKNRAAIVVIAAVMFIPSLYAWFNILPSWDPYADTSGVKIAVANLDEGAEVGDKQIDVGNDIVLSLMENESLGWQFVSEEEALRGVEHGDYYASIIIPEDFSEKLSSVISDNPEKPELEYYINEKINAIAPKVTSAGASSVVDKTEKDFIKVANEAIFEIFNEVGLELEVNRLSIENFRDSVFRLEDELPELERILGIADEDLATVDQSIDKAYDGMEKAEDISEQAEELSDRIAEMLKEGDQAVRQYVPVVKQDLRLAQKALQQIPTVAERLAKRGTDIDGLLDDVEKSSNRLLEGSESLGNLAEMLEEKNEELAEQTKIEETIDSLNEEFDKLQRLKEDLQETIKKLETGDNIGVDITQKIDDATKELVDRMDSISKTYEETIIPAIKDDIDRIKELAPNVKDRIIDLKDKNYSLLDKIAEWEKSTEELDIERYKDDIREILPVVRTSLERVENILRVFNRIHELTNGRFLGQSIEALTTVQEKLTSVENLLSTTLAALEMGEGIPEDLANLLKRQVKDIDQKLESLIQFSENEVVDAFNEAIATLEKIEESVQDDLAGLRENADRLSSLGETMLEHAENPERTIQLFQNLVSRVESGQETITSLIEINQKIQDRFDEGLFDASLDRLHSAQKDLEQMHSRILDTVSEARVSKNNVGDIVQNIKAQAIEMDREVESLLRYIDTDLMPRYEKASSRANEAIKEGNRMLIKATAYFPRIYELLEKAENGVSTGKDGLNKAHEAFPEVRDKVGQVADLIRKLEERGDLDQLINLMKNDPSVESEFFAEPIILNEHELFPMPNYGSAMAPFFTTLSLWVGALILMSSLIVDIPNKKDYKSYETYFGRILTFWGLGLAQALIVTMGNIFFLETFVVHKLLFVLFSLLISLTFITIVYTLVSVFGNTGKVLGIILLVMQLGASGGTFPIQMTPEFFQKIHAFLPFTHALQLLREATGGVIWPVTWKHIIVLLIYIAVFLFIGIALKERINKSSDKFMEKARESEIVL